MPNNSAKTLDEEMRITHAEQLAAFVVRASYDHLSETAQHQLKIRVLDSLGCAIGALAKRIDSLHQPYLKNKLWKGGYT